jgi:hypothetical protein
MDCKHWRDRVQQHEVPNLGLAPLQRTVSGLVYWPPAGDAEPMGSLLLWWE